MGMEPAGRMPSVFEEDFETGVAGYEMYPVELRDGKSAIMLGIYICTAQIIEITRKADAYSARWSVNSAIIVIKPPGKNGIR
jgi:hypothetical protein